METIKNNWSFWISLFAIGFLTSCGGLPDVKDRPVIEAPPDFKNDIPIETKPPEPAVIANGSGKKRTPQKKMAAQKLVSVFQKKPARERKKLLQSDKVFRVGEKTTFALTWFSIKAGDMTMEVHPFVYIGERKAYHFMGTAKSSAALNLIHSVDDWIESYADAETLYPFKSALHGVETDRVREGMVLFDYDRNKIEYWSKRVHLSKGTKDKRRTDELTIPGILDIFTAAFYLRALPLKVGEKYISDVYNEGKHIVVEAEVLREEIIETPLGELSAIVVRPVARFEGILQTSGDSTIWLSNDDRHFILKLETKIKLGYLMGMVKNIEKGE